MSSATDNSAWLMMSSRFLSPIESCNWWKLTPENAKPITTNMLSTNVPAMATTTSSNKSSQPHGTRRSSGNAGSNVSGAVARNVHPGLLPAAPSHRESWLSASIPNAHPSRLRNFAAVDCCRLDALIPGRPRVRLLTRAFVCAPFPFAPFTLSARARICPV